MKGDKEFLGTLRGFDDYVSTSASLCVCCTPAVWTVTTSVRMWLCVLVSNANAACGAVRSVDMVLDDVTE